MTEPVKTAAELASQRTREELLAAGHRLLVTAPAATAFSHLTANRIATTAGRTTGAFFHQWPTIEDYLQDLLAYVMHPDRSVALRATAAAIAAELAAGHSFTKALIAGCGDTVQATTRDPQTIVELLAWVRSLHDETFRSQMARHYPGMDADATEVFGALIQLLGREVREPFTVETIAAICAAVAQGLATREALTPGFYPRDLYGWLILALTPLMTRAPDDTRTATGFVTDLGLEPPARPDANE
jgi:AcrR family transcriptional regulator